MPNNGMQWDVANKRGNPTKSVLVKKLLRSVKLHEVRGTGKESMEKRALTHDEYQ